MKSSRLRKLALLIFCTLLLAAFVPFQLHAQIDTGRIDGTVIDSSGAVVPDADISLTNDDTNIIRTATTSGDGNYTFPDLKTGSYTLTVKHSGFEQYVSSDINVHIQQDVTMNITLSPGKITESVTVTGAEPVIQTENASLGQTIDGLAVNNLPLNGRDWTSLPQIAVGVTTLPGGSPGQDLYVINGIDDLQTDFRLDGIDDNIEQYGTAASIKPPPDAIQEFKLQSGDFNAEFGHSAGGIINAEVKSGTNQLHGDVWEYIRNNAFDANDYFSNLNGQPKPEYHQNQFGGTIGGPVYIPKLYSGKDKTFFFFDYQGTRIISPASSTATVPSQGMILSNFTNLQDLITYNQGTRTDALGRTFSLGTVFDPATTREIAAGAVDSVSGFTNTLSYPIYVRDPFFAGGSIARISNFTGMANMLNQIPASRLDPNAVKLLQTYPGPTKTGVDNNYFANPKDTDNSNQMDVRIDQHFNNQNMIFGVFDWSHALNLVPGALPGIAIGGSGGPADVQAYAVAVSYTHVFAPTLTNELRFGFDSNVNSVTPLYGDTPGIPEQFGIQGVPQGPGNGGLPSIAIAGLTQLGAPGWGETLWNIKSDEVTDNVTKVYGGHTLKAGFQIDIIRADITQPIFPKGSFTYSGQYTDIPNQGSGLTGISDLLLLPTTSTVPGGISNVGGMSSISASNYAATNDQRYYTGAYFQDDWRITSSFTLNLGLRWDHYTPYTETSGRQANFVQSDGGNGNTAIYYMPRKTCNSPRSSSFNAVLAEYSIPVVCTGSSTGEIQDFNFAPRVGFAYQVTPKFVVRGGYGITYGALDNIGYGFNLGNAYPFLYTAAYNSPNSNTPFTLPTDGSIPTLETGLVSLNIQNPALINGNGLNLYERQYNFQTPYTESLNFTAEQQIDKNSSIQISYVGTLGHHLDTINSVHNSPSEILPPGVNEYQYIPFPSLGINAAFQRTTANSNYNSLQTVYQHQLRDGLSILANYTWSKCLTDQLNHGGAGYRSEWLPGIGQTGNYAVCDNDATDVVHFSGTYDLPFGKHRKWLNAGNKLAEGIEGGWVTNFIYTFQTGQPFTVNCPIATTADFSCYAFTVPGQNMYAGPHDQSQWLNPAAFAQPPVATQIGQSDYSVLGGGFMQARGPGFYNVDFSLFKEFGITESTRLQFRAEAFNLLNTPQFGDPGNLDFTNKAYFSEITSLRNNARLLQFALKLYW